MARERARPRRRSCPGPAAPANGSAGGAAVVRLRVGRFASQDRRRSSARRAEGPVRAAGGVLLPAGRAVAGSPRRPAGSATKVSRVSEVLERRDVGRRWRSVRWGSGRPTPGRAPRRRCAPRSTRRSSAPAPCGRGRASGPPSTRGGPPWRRSRATVARSRTRARPARRVAAPTPGVGTNRLRRIGRPSWSLNVTG